MIEPSIQIERIVREVLRELGVAPQGASPAIPQPQTGGPAVPPPSQADRAESASQATAAADGQLILTARIVTMADLGDRLEGVRRLTVPPGAVVTPAVRDELYRRGVALVFGSGSACAATARPGGPLRLVLVTTEKSFDAGVLAGALRSESLEVQQQATDCLLAAVDRLAGEVALPDTLGVLVTRHAAAAICLANRLAGVRAVLGTDAATAVAAAASVGANVLVVDPQVGSFFQIKQIVGEFCRGGVRPCPEVFRRRLA